MEQTVFADSLKRVIGTAGRRVLSHSSKQPNPQICRSSVFRKLRKIMRQKLGSSNLPELSRQRLQDVAFCLERGQIVLVQGTQAPSWKSSSLKKKSRTGLAFPSGHWSGIGSQEQAPAGLAWGGWCVIEFRTLNNGSRPRCAPRHLI